MSGREGEDYEYPQSLEKDHGLIEHRDYCLFADVQWYKEHKDWKNLCSIIMLRFRREGLS